MKGQLAWLKYSQEIQYRSLQYCPLTVKNAKELYNQICAELKRAYDARYLSTKLFEFGKLLRISSKDRQLIEIWGGLEKASTKNFKRSKDIPHFSRSDGCWFDFAITIDESLEPAEIIGFDFEIRFPDKMPVKFVRFDLNLPDHDNQADGLRFHFHPGSDDLMVHSPPMSPLEILHLFLYGLEIPEKPRKTRV